MDAAPEIDAGEAYSLHPNVAVRPEPFGALVYHYGNRKLVFLKSLRMVAVVRSLDGERSVDQVFREHGVTDRQRANYLGALSSLLRSDMIVRTAPVYTPEVLADASAR